MFHNLIKTEKYLLIVDDSELKEGDWFLSKENVVHNNFGWNFGDRKVIAHLPLNNSPILEGLPLLPPLPTESDVMDKMLDSLFGEVNGSNIHIREAFKMGYNKAKESFIYTEADMSKAIDMAQETELIPYTDDYGPVYSPSEIMDEINQPKLPVAFAQQGDTWQGKYLY